MLVVQSQERIDFLHIQKGETANAKILDQVIVATTRFSNSQNYIDTGCAIELSPCSLEKHQIHLFRTLIRLGASPKSSEPLIKYTARIGHLNLLSKIFDTICNYTSKNGHAHENLEENRPNILLNGALLFESVRRSNYRLIQHLCEQYSAALYTNNGFRALELAVSLRNTHALRILIDNGATTSTPIPIEGIDTNGIDDEDNNGRLLMDRLRIATIRRVFGIPLRDGGTSQRIIEGLIRGHECHGNQVAFIEFCDTLLVPMLVEIGNPALLRAAWERGADLDSNDSTPLFMSIISGHWRVVRFLTREVAVIRVRDLENERKQLKQEWRTKKKKNGGSFLVELFVIWIRLKLKHRNKIPMTKIIPDQNNPASVTFISISAPEPVFTEADANTEFKFKSFYKPHIGVVARQRNIRFNSIFRRRRFPDAQLQYQDEVTDDNAVEISGWCATQLGTTVLDSDYWFKTGAVVGILTLAVFIAERSMPLHGMVISIFEVLFWLLKRTLLKWIVELKRESG
ncbi:hypothetical protein HK100_001113 [Physocladia obscura]|uniref:Ankyrin repeat protein n=1 Tax=Physocladia obscura TaxID=109957 RepID=A0AAD5XER4_9FUNG|nr:hypothetical protein HK100_001113 [Physocladia obscura]